MNRSFRSPLLLLLSLLVWASVTACASESVSPGGTGSVSSSGGSPAPVAPEEEPAAAGTALPATPQVTNLNQGIVPVNVRIPSIDVDAAVVPVGNDEEGRMDVPENFEEVAWYAIGTNPGAPGNAVMAGHVDSRTGPAVFYELKTLEAGDLIYVTDEAGNELAFEVIGKESYPYDDAPIDLVFGPSGEARLNLITCTGVFDRSIRSHLERLVVFTKLVPPAA